MKHKVEHPGRGGTRHGVRNATSNARYSLSSPNTNRVDFKAINDATPPALPIVLARQALFVEQACTADMEDGQPLPPLIEDSCVWHVVRRSKGRTLWRRLFFFIFSRH
jgi:hypothetical protein